MTVAEAIQERLRQLTALGSVAGAVNFAAVHDSGKLPPTNPQPACWVLPLGESASANANVTGTIRQQVTVEIGVLLALRRPSDARGDEGLDAVLPVHHAVLRHLVGWAPADHGAITYAGAESQGFVQQYVFWLARFQTRRLLQQPMHQ